MVISSNHIISKQEVDGNTQTVYNFYKLVQGQTSLSALDLSDVCGRYAYFLSKFLLSQIQTQTLFTNSLSQCMIIHICTSLSATKCLNK